MDIKNVILLRPHFVQFVLFKSTVNPNPQRNLKMGTVWIHFSIISGVTLFKDVVPM